MDYTLTPITYNELQIALLQWAKDEDWNYSLLDVATYLALESSFIFALKYNGQFIGCVIVTNYHIDKSHHSLASIGLYLVNKEYRGRLLEKVNDTPGSLLWEKVTSIIKDCTYICLNSISSLRLQNYYHKKGLTLSGNINLHLSSSSFFNNSNLKRNFIDQEDPLYISFENNQEKIIAYDNKLFKNVTAERSKFLHTWLSRPDAIVSVYQNGKNIEGYGTLTICSQNVNNTILRLSPAYADTLDVASKILFSLFRKAAANGVNKIELNLPEINSSILAILKDYGFNHSEESKTHLMTNNPQFKIKNNTLLKTIALAPLELPHEAILASV